MRKKKTAWKRTHPAVGWGFQGLPQVSRNLSLDLELPEAQIREIFTPQHGLHLAKLWRFAPPERGKEMEKYTPEI